MGVGMSTVVENYKQEDPGWILEKDWRQEDEAGEQELDRINRELSESMEYITMQRELYAQEKELFAEAWISLDEKSGYGCTVTVSRDATGEVLYCSGLIEPGHHIKKIPLQSKLKKGYYPCTAIWSFYTEDDEYAGEIAWKVTVIIR